MVERICICSHTAKFEECVVSRRDVDESQHSQGVIGKSLKILARLPVTVG